MALVWARLHPCPVDEVPAHWGEVDLHGGSVCPLAGVGAPWVAEFAPADLGAALGISVDAAKQLLGDALELAHRLPRLWALVQELAVPVWRARLIARETRDLSRDAAKFADRLIAATPDKIGSVHAARLVQEARLYFDPDRAIADEDEALAKRGVWSRPGPAPATTEMWMTLDTPDAELFDQCVSRVAGDLRQLGDTDGLDVRRARAVGILADPQYALDLLSGREGAVRSIGGSGIANLFVHLTPRISRPSSLVAPALLRSRSSGPPPPGCSPTGSPGSPRRAARSSSARSLTSRAPARSTGTTHPPRCATSPAARRARVFPGCRRDSRGCDLDHITPYIPTDEGGPPGQTRAGNLAPLCRTHHRVKTHTAWDYKSARRRRRLRVDRAHRPPVRDRTRGPAATGHRPIARDRDRHRPAD